MPAFVAQASRGGQRTFRALELTASPWLQLQPLRWTGTILFISPGTHDFENVNSIVVFLQEYLDGESLWLLLTPWERNFMKMFN